MDKGNTIQMRFDGEIQIFEISGDLVFGFTQGAKEALLQGVNKEASRYVMDISTLRNIDSTGMGVFITFMKHVNNSKKEIDIIIGNSFIFELFQIAKLDKIFTLTLKQSTSNRGE